MTKMNTQEVLSIQETITKAQSRVEYFQSEIKLIEDKGFHMSGHDETRLAYMQKEMEYITDAIHSLIVAHRQLQSTLLERI